MSLHDCGEYKKSLCYPHTGTTFNKPATQIPQRNSPISYNASFCNRNVHMCAYFCYKMMHCEIFVCCIVGFVRSSFIINQVELVSICHDHMVWVSSHEPTTWWILQVSCSTLRFVQGPVSKEITTCSCIQINNQHYNIKWIWKLWCPFSFA